MSMTFQEKSLWITLAGVLATFSLYFCLAWVTLPQAPAARDVLPHQAALFMTVTALLVVVLVAGHVALALCDRRAETDERDRLFELKGTRNGAYVLATGVFLALCVALVTEGNAIMAHVLLAFWVLAQVVEIASQLVYYRRSA